MNAKITTVVLLAASGLAWALPAGPRRTREPLEAQRTAHGPGGTPRAIAYTVAPVTHPARITGRVTFAGTVPTVPPITVPPTANPGVCGASSPSVALLVDPASHGVRNAVVYLADIARGAAPRVETVAVGQRGCVYNPHVVAAAVGSTLRYSSSDPGVLHTVHGLYSLAGAETWFNRATPPGITLSSPIDRGGIHRLVCDSGHTWMLGYVHAFDHPYFAVTDAEGRYALADVPPGTYQLHVWHEGWAVASTDPNGRPTWSPPVEADQRVTVSPDGVMTVDFAYTAAPAVSATVVRR